jgi:hypothetical protein
MRAYMPLGVIIMFQGGIVPRIDRTNAVRLWIYRRFALAGAKGPDYKGATARALRLSVRTTDFHSVKRGSTPLGRATSPSVRIALLIIDGWAIDFVNSPVERRHRQAIAIF